MTIQEKAREFALKILEDQISAVEKAYLVGYEEGKSSVVIPQVSSVQQSVILEEDIEWHDFGLPSGKIWGFSKKEVTRPQALKYEVPTFNQVLELLGNCRLSDSYDTEGKLYLMINDLNGIEHSIDMAYKNFWVKEQFSPSPNIRKVNAAIFRNQDNELSQIQRFMWDRCADCLIASEKLRLVTIK